LCRAPGCWRTCGAFSLRPVPAERDLGAKKAAGQRERKGSERRKVLRSKPLVGGRRPSFRSVPCADDCRRYAGAPLRALHRSGYEGVACLRYRRLCQRRRFGWRQPADSTRFRLPRPFAQGRGPSEPGSLAERSAPRLAGFRPRMRLEPVEAFAASPPPCLERTLAQGLWRPSRTPCAPLRLTTLRALSSEQRQQVDGEVKRLPAPFGYR
jgi:hypothetical protein